MSNKPKSIGPTKSPHVMNAIELQSHENPTNNSHMTKGMSAIERGRFERKHPGYHGKRRDKDIKLKSIFSK